LSVVALVECALGVWGFRILEGITRFCFAASYAVALGLELLQAVRPRHVQRLLALAFGGAGLIAHTLFLAVQRPPVAGPYGSLLLLAWVLAIFYLYGTVHHRRLAWALFVLPLVLGLVILAGRVAPSPDAPPPSGFFTGLAGPGFWGAIHGGLLLLAAVGICVGFVASAMYLAQAHRLKAKLAPTQGLRLLSLERLESMNRRAINLAFPLLTVGLLVGAALTAQRDEALKAWSAGKVLGTAGLWLLFVLLMYLRYGLHLRGRHLAFGSLAAFLLLLATLAASHPFAGGLP
jgi:ABC-type transport system involved in cytochrome c biogenesis permease subunit